MIYINNCFNEKIYRLKIKFKKQNYSIHQRILKKFSMHQCFIRFFNFLIVKFFNFLIVKLLNCRIVKFSNFQMLKFSNFRTLKFKKNYYIDDNYVNLIFRIFEQTTFHNVNDQRKQINLLIMFNMLIYDNFVRSRIESIAFNNFLRD